MKAIILAAGQGTRLRPITDDKPKCMVQFQERPIIDHIVENFRLCGIDEIIVVSGYKSNILERHLKDQNIQFVINKKYDSTNMLYSLFCVENQMNDDLIISYSDIIFSTQILQNLITSKNNFSVSIDLKWEKLWRIRMDSYISDVETLKMDSKGLITEIGKVPSNTEEIQGQYIGLIKIKKNQILTIKNIYDQLKNKKLNNRTRDNMFMTDFLQFMIEQQIQISSEKIQGGWLEIDTIQDLDRYSKDLKELPVWEWQNLLGDVKEIAKAAGEKIKNLQNMGEIKIKIDNSPLTKADLLADEFIKNELGGLNVKYPILSEEGVSKNTWEERKKWTTYWLIDPIDGTKEYIQGRKDYTVNIALIHKNEPVLGVVYCPAYEEIYYASKNWGSFKEDIKNKKISLLKNSKQSDPLRVVISRSHKGDLLKNFLEKIPFHQIIQMGSSLKICRIADGTCDIYPRLGPLSEWDIAAAGMILREAGGEIFNLDGDLITFDTVNGRISSFVACGATVQNMILDILQKKNR